MFRFHATLSLVVVAAACGGETPPQLIRGQIVGSELSAGAEAKAWSSEDLIAAAPLNARGLGQEFILALPPGGLLQRYRIEIAPAGAPPFPVLGPDEQSVLLIAVCSPALEPYPLLIEKRQQPCPEERKCGDALFVQEECLKKAMAYCEASAQEVALCDEMIRNDCAPEMDPICQMNHPCWQMVSACREPCLDERNSVNELCSQPIVCEAPPPEIAFAPNFLDNFGCSGEPNNDPMAPGSGMR